MNLVGRRLTGRVERFDFCHFADWLREKGRVIYLSLDRGVPTGNGLLSGFSVTLRLES